MTTDRIKEIRERVEKASPGPWDGIISSYAVRYLGPTVGKMEHGYEICGVYEGQYQGADKEFIAEARQDIPWLLTELESAQAELARLKSQLATDQSPGTVQTRPPSSSGASSQSESSAP